jgi:hypothetical protein
VKLAELDPRDVGARAARALVDHVGRAASQLGPSYTVRVDGGDPASSDVALTMRALTEYAQRGLPVWDWTDTDMVADALISALSALYGSPCGDLTGTAADPSDVDLDPSEPLTLAIAAADARLRIDTGFPVTARDVGALAGISGQGVRRYLRSGELEASNDRPQRIAAADAARWLAARGVPGFR